MKNNLNLFLLWLLLTLPFFSNLNANENFTFDITEIEITEAGNKIKGFNGGKAYTEEGDVITANTFTYNKITNILEAYGNVKYENKIKDITIYSDEVIYLKNEEKIYTKKNSKAEKAKTKDKISANTFTYNKITNILEAYGNVKYENKIKDITIYSDEVIYLKNEEKIYTKKNSKAESKGVTINAQNFIYDKSIDTLNANKNVKIIDNLKDYIIEAEDVTYIRDIEKIYTKGATNALIEGKYKFKSEDVLLLRNIMELSSKKTTHVNDSDSNTYVLDEFKYQINKKFLKGKNITVSSINSKNEKDTYYFSDGFFNLENKNFISKNTKIKIHNNIFGLKDNDPRVYGASSYGNKDKIIIEKGIFTSCKINKTCPAWSIKSKKITHDKIKQNVIYENALLKLYGVPVFYFPKFFHPDPTVKRRTGFLQPQLNNSKILGSSLYLPYFKVLSKNRDYTFKPTIFDGLKKKKYILQNEYRQENKNSSLITDFSMTKGYKSSIDNKTNSISHLFLRYDYDFKLQNYSQSKLKAQIERVSNDSYLKVFQNNLFPSPVIPKSKNTLATKIDLDIKNNDYSLSTGFQIFEDLGKRNNDRYQYVLPYYNYSRSYVPSNNLGTFNLYFTGNNKLTNTNNLTTTSVNDLNYESFDYISNKGFKNNFGVYVKNINTIAKNNSKYKNSLQVNEMSMFEFKSALPMSKTNSESYNLFTPKISVRVNPQNNMKNHKNSNKIITANNVFDINRLGISDSFEGGKSITFGLDYKIDLFEQYDSSNLDMEEGDEEEDTTKWRSIIFPKKPKYKDKYLEFKIANVLRDKFDEDIPSSSTINKKSSNIFGSINNHLFENIDLEYSFSLDNNLKTFQSHEINSTIYVNNFVTTFNYSEQRDELGTSHVLKNTSAYKINENNYLTFGTRRNKEINLTEYYDLSYEYRTDCITAALKFNKVFYKDRDLLPTENLFFTITIIPITKYEPILYKR